MAEPAKRLTVYDFKVFKQQGMKATSMTAYDYPFAKMCDQAGIDLIICGGSVGMVCLGYETTVPVTMEELLHHLRPVAATAKRAINIEAVRANSQPFQRFHQHDWRVKAIASTH